MNEKKTHIFAFFCICVYLNRLFTDQHIRGRYIYHSVILHAWVTVRTEFNRDQLKLSRFDVDLHRVGDAAPTSWPPDPDVTSLMSVIPTVTQIVVCRLVTNV